MFRIIHILTGKIIGDPCHTEREAQHIATADKRARLEKDKYGRRALASLKYKLPWATVVNDYTILEMIGIWIDSDQGRSVPEETTEENELVFVDKKGVKHLGMYDAEDGLFRSDDDSSFPPDRVVEFMFLPECLHDS